MPLYRCGYEIDIEAESPEEAARRAYYDMTDPAGLPPALQVRQHCPGGPESGEAVLIDLSEVLSPGQADETVQTGTSGPPVTPHELYWAYPDCDLLPCEPPGEQESFAAFLARIGDPYRAAGDGLFGFLLSELGDEPATSQDRQECLRRLCRAIGELETVRARLAAELRDDHPQRNRRQTDERAPPLPPQRAWLIVELDWEHAGEVCSPRGERPRPKLFYEKERAEAERRRLCQEFFQAQTPARFGVDFESCFWDRLAGVDYDPEAVTWDELREAGFPDPYYVLEVEA